MKYQIFEEVGTERNAGSKAPLDVMNFAEEAGFKRLTFFKWGDRKLSKRISGQICRFFEYCICFFRLKRKSILLMQFPYVRGGRPWRKLFLEAATKIKGIKVITLIHDLNELRNIDAEYQSKLVRYSMGISSMVVVHNKKMAEYLFNNGLPMEKMVCLDVFDYATPLLPKQEFSFERSLIIAGNLASNKCGYLRDIDKIGGVSISLYGTNYDGIQNEHIKYHGGFSPDGLPTMISSGFGLVWDGDSISTCEGCFGTYLKYNNPHKFSLYIAAGIPVVAWKESAIAEFIEKNRVGILVSSLKEAAERIMAMEDDEYAHLKLNVLELAEKIRSGFYTKKALEEACERIKMP